MRIANVLAMGLLAALVPRVGAGSDLPLDAIKLPPSFRIDIYADDVPDARSLALGDQGTLFVSTRRQGVIYALRDRDGDQRAEAKYVIASDLNTPNGIAFHDGKLYVATRQRLLRYDDIENRLQQPPQPVVVADGFPSDPAHGWRYLAIGPDRKLYVSVGAPCNICDRAGYAHIVRLNLDGSGREIYAHGVRNSVGMTWHPQTGELWFTDNGRDWLGDDLPPDELNRAPRARLHFGYPYCHGKGIPDPEFGAGRDCARYTPPAQELGPHVAALGLRFYTGTMFPPQYRNNIFIAEHGSWNRSEKIGYRVTRIVLDQQGRPSAYEPFAEGWLQNDKVWGRPVDVLVMPDGALLVSDDHAGVVYRISYQEQRR
ncbi:MAG: sorbosone dehydrogenase family protein [Xanthomonadaceae bacterium]|nr:sorbosone dehydrogenase family protein [Xanthomonadaceae bacterium]